MRALVVALAAFGDFHAFYCGGAAVLHGADPYLQASILRCEHARQPYGLYSGAPGVTAPVPFPGYAFTLFAAFSALPYVPAALLWMVLLLAAVVGASVQAWKLAGRPAWSVLAMLAVPYALTVLVLGETASVALFALCSSALALRLNRPAAAAAWLCVCAVLPHVAAPAFVAMLLWNARSRLAAVCGMAALLAIDLAISGPVGAISYLTRVLPAHAQSEVGYVAQYGVTWILHAAGASDAIALRTGDVSYALFAAAGIWTAFALARKCGDAGLLVLIPAAFSVTGGPFIHYSEITLALPAALVLYARSFGAQRSLLACAVLLVAIPWQWVIPDAALAVPAALAAAFAVALWTLRLGPERAVRAVGAALIGSAVILMVALRAGPQVQHLVSPHVDAALAQASWTGYIRAQGASAGVAWILAKLPTWAGLALLALCGLYGAAQEKFVRPVAIVEMPVGPH